MIKKILQSSLFKASGIYTLANIINSAIPFFLLPVLTVYLTPTDYGIVSMFGVLLGFFAPFLGLNMHGAVNRKYFDENKNFSLYLSTSFYILIASTSLILLIIILFSNFISQLTSFPEKWLFLIVLGGFGNSIIQITLTLWQVRGRAVNYGLFQILQTVLNLVLTLIFVISLDLGWIGRVNAQVFAISVFSIIGLIIVIRRENLTLGWDKEYTRDILKFGVPLIPHALGAFLITMTDRIFVTNMVGISETGVYTVGYQIGLVISILQDSFNKAWMPYLYAKLNLKSIVVNKKIVAFTYGYFVVILLITLLLGAISPFIVDIFIGKSFEGATQYIIWIALGFAFNGMYKMVSGVIYYEKKTHFLSTVTFLTALLNLVFNYFLIKLNGAVGAAQATALAFFVSFILTWILANKVHPMPWNLLKKSVNEKN